MVNICSSLLSLMIEAGNRNTRKKVPICSYSHILPKPPRMGLDLEGVEVFGGGGGGGRGVCGDGGDAAPSAAGGCGGEGGVAGTIDP